MASEAREQVTRTQVTHTQTTHWVDILRSIEAFEDVAFDYHFVTELQQETQRVPAARPIQFHNPSFKSCHTNELGPCTKDSWPAVSITGANCKLQCEHCQAAILKPMLPATTPEKLWRLVNELIERGAQGMLLTGGSNHQNEIQYDPFWATVKRIKTQFPGFEIACHTALLNDDKAQRMADAGVDVAMIDIIGARDTIRRVYHLKREVSDFATSLAALCRTQMRVVPHIVLGLHFGKLLGEWHALEMIKQHPVSALVLVAVMPQFANWRFQQETLGATTIGRFIQNARRELPDLPISLGCARPTGLLKTEIDAYAAMAGVDRIAHPAEGIVQLSQAIGRDILVSQDCCSVALKAPASQQAILPVRKQKTHDVRVPQPVRLSG